MTSRDFCYWLQGLFELGEPEHIPAAQTTIIKNHLAMVFKHEIDPSNGSPEHNKALSDIHRGISPGGSGFAGGGTKMDLTTLINC